MNKGIIFFIGVLMGILICVVLYYFDVKVPRDIFHPENKNVVTQIDTVYFETPKKQQKVNVEKKTEEIHDTDSANIKHPEVEDSIYETEFSLEGIEHDEVFSDQLLRTRTVKVKLLNQDTKGSEEFFQSFEIQHWSTPIKNKITYSRNQNMLKIKGIEIENLSIVVWNDNYFLELGNRHYAIPETNNFEKLNTVQIP